MTLVFQWYFPPLRGMARGCEPPFLNLRLGFPVNARSFVAVN
jgi:hypothetical protein